MSRAATMHREAMLSSPTSTATEPKQHRPFIPHSIRIFAIPIILGWVA